MSDTHTTATGLQAGGQAKKKERASCLERMARARAAETPGNDPTGGLALPLFCCCCPTRCCVGCLLFPPTETSGPSADPAVGLMRALTWLVSHRWYCVLGDGLFG